MASNVSQMNSWLILGNAALKSNRTIAPFFDFTLIFCAAKSMSKIFLNICLPGKKPRCARDTQLAAFLSRETLNIDAKIRFEASTIESGLVELGSCTFKSPIGSPSPFGRHTKKAKLKSRRVTIMLT